MPSTSTREEVKKLLSSLLIARKEALTTGVPIAKLDQDYKEETGRHIPFREFGHGCLVDFLQSLTDGLSIRYWNGMYYAHPVVSEKTKHVSTLVAGQNHRKIARSTRRLYRPSAYFPKVPLPRTRLDSRQLSEIAKFVKNNRNGVHHSRLLDFVKYNLNCNIDWVDLGRQLRDIRHEVDVAGDWVYPAATQYRHGEYKQLQPQDSSTSGESQANVEPSRLNGQNNLKPAGFSHSEDDDYSKDYYPVNNDTLQKEENNISKNIRPFDERRSDHPTCNSNENQTVKYPPGFHELKETNSINDDATDNEAISHLINERTRIRLQKLIEKYPDGIWCAELPELYRKEYTIPLSYEELGFVSVIEFVSHLPGIFQCVRPQDKGDFKLFNAKTNIPNVKPRERPKVPSLAALHNIYEQYVEPTQPVPTVLLKSTMEKLIPNGVMTADETVAQICVTELDRGIHEYIDVIVCDVYTPSFFWIQLLQRVTKFQRFMTELHEFYELEAKNYLLPMAVMERGMNCACTYDGKWHRAIIKSVRPDNYVTVMFYDYGTIKSYPADCIHFLHRKFSNLPAQAIPCGLYNVKPVTGTHWLWNVACEFVNRTTNVPLVATIATIDTENNSMMVALTNTEGPEDLHINDWMVQSGFAVYGSMGKTVDMNDRPYNQPLDSNAYETTQGQNSLSVIPEEDESYITNFTFAKSIAKGLDIQQHMNECMRLSAARFKFDVEIFLKNGFSAKPDVTKIFEELINVLRPTCVSGHQQCSESGETPSTPILPQQSNGPMENSTAESNITNEKPESTFSWTLEPKVANKNKNPPIGVLINSTIPPGPITPPQCNGFAEHQSDQTLKPNFNFNATTNPFPTNYVPESKPAVTESASIFSGASTDWVTSLRQRFQDSLSLSAKNFYDRVSSSKKPSEPTTFQFKDTNPFRFDVLSEIDSPSLAEKSQPKSPHSSLLSRTKNPELQPQSRVIYESGPVLYDNVDKNYSRKEQNSEIYEIMKERQKLIESKRVNVESWIKHGFNVNNHYSNTSTPYSVTPTKSIPVVNETPAKPLVCNGTHISNNTPLRSAAEWLDAIDCTINFKKNENLSPSSEKTRSEGMQKSLDAKQLTKSNASELENKTALNQNHSVNANTTKNEIAYVQDAMGQMIWSVRKIQISTRFVFLIIFRDEGWIAVEEFAAAFTNMSPDTMLKILNIQRVQIPFLKIGRSDNSSLFNELDGTSVNVPRDQFNKIDQFLNLVPLKSALKILNKLNIIKQKQVVLAAKDQIFPEKSTVLYDIRTVINAWGQFQQEYSRLN